jgi:hypothetical protein
VSYGVDGVKELAFLWDEGVARVAVHMPAKEVKVLTAEVHSPFSGVTHWWNYQQRFWRELDEPRIDFAPYSKGKWKDPTLDLRFGARFTNSDPGGAAQRRDTQGMPDNAADWTSASFDDRDWTPCRLGVLPLQGAAESEPAWVRRRFTVPPEWFAEGGSIHLVSGSWGGPHYLDETRMTLNGTLLRDYTLQNYNEYDVTRLLMDGANVLAFQLRGGRKHLGFSGNVYLYHRRPPTRSLDLSGPWQGTDEHGKPASLGLPGTGAIRAPTRRVVLPAEWRGRYRVRLYMEGERSSILGAWVNGRLVRRHHHSFGERCDVDITAMLRFGEENEIILAHGHDWSGMDLRPDQVPSWDIREVRLDAFEDTSPSRPSASGAR